MKTVRISRNGGDWSGIVIAMLMFWSFFFQLSKFILPSNRLCFLYLFVTMVLMVVTFLTSMTHRESERRGPKLGVSEAFLPVMFFFILYRNANIRNGSYMSEVTYLALFTFFFFSRSASEWVRAGFSCIVAFGGVHLACSLVLQYVPGLWEQTVGAFYRSTLGDVSYGWLLSQRAAGYSTGLTNHFSTNGMYMAITCGAYFGTAVFTQGKKPGKWWALVGVAAFGLILTAKRAHILFGATAIIAAYMLCTGQMVRNRFLKLLVVLIVSLTGVYILSLNFSDSFAIFDRLRRTIDGSLGSSGRETLSQISLDFWRGNRLLGIGWDGYKYRYLQSYGVMLNGHNTYLQLLAETGMLGAGAFYAFFLYQLLTTLSLVRRNAERKVDLPREASLLLYFSVFFQIFFLLYCLTGNPLYDVQTFCPYLYSCAVTQYYRSHYTRISVSPAQSTNGLGVVV